MGFHGTGKTRPVQCWHHAWPRPHDGRLWRTPTYAVELWGTTVSERGDERVRPKLGRSRSKEGVGTKRFISRVVRAANEAGAVGLSRRDATARRRLSHLHRGAGVAQGLR